MRALPPRASGPPRGGCSSRGPPAPGPADTVRASASGTMPLPLPLARCCLKPEQASPEEVAHHPSTSKSSTLEVNGHQRSAIERSCSNHFRVPPQRACLCHSCRPLRGSLSIFCQFLARSPERAKEEKSHFALAKIGPRGAYPGAAPGRRPVYGRSARTAPYHPGTTQACAGASRPAPAAAAGWKRAGV